MGTILLLGGKSPGFLQGGIGNAGLQAQLEVRMLGTGRERKGRKNGDLSHAELA